MSLLNRGGQASQPSQSYSAPALPAAPAAPSQDTAEVQAKESIENKRRAISRNRTIFTGPQGLSDEEKSGTSLKTLTGS
jgi:hypothetical protein